MGNFFTRKREFPGSYTVEKGRVNGQIFNVSMFGARLEDVRNGVPVNATALMDRFSVAAPWTRNEGMKGVAIVRIHCEEKYVVGEISEVGAFKHKGVTYRLYDRSNSRPLYDLLS